MTLPICDHFGHYKPPPQIPTFAGLYGPLWPLGPLKIRRALEGGRNACARGCALGGEGVHYPP